MAPSTTRPSPDVLLAHVAWVRRLARLLVVDADDAADVEQETWRQAFERPPQQESRDAADVDRQRGWLAAVARNVARKLMRSRETRERHERGVASPAAAAAASEVTARAELHRRVVDAVLALDEMYRAPLLLRFFDDLSAQEVAARLGVPVETARTRIKRGLALLRSKLGGERGLDRFAGLLFGGIVVSKVAKVGGAVVLAAAALVGSYQWWIAPARVARDADSTLAAGTEPVTAKAVEAEATTPPPARVETERAEVDRGAGETTVASGAAIAVIEGKVVDEAGRPVAGATVGLDRVTSGSWWQAMTYRRLMRQFLADDGREHTWRVTTSASDGSFRFEDIDASAKWAIGAMHDPLGIGWSETLGFSGAPPVASTIVALQRGVVIFGSVRDERGLPVAVANVWMSGATEEPAAGDNGFGSDFEDNVRSSEDGTYRSLPLPWRFVRQRVYVYSGRPDLAHLDAGWEPLPTGVTEVRRDLVVPTLTTLRGRILGLDGLPARLSETLLPRLGDDARRTQTKQTLAAVAFSEDPRARPEIVDHLGTNEPGTFYLNTDHLYGTIVAGEDRYEIPLRSSALRYVAIVARDRLLGVAEIPTPPTSPDIAIDPSLLPEKSRMHVLRLHLRNERDGSPLRGVTIHAQVTERMANGQMMMSMLNFGIPSDPPADRELELPLAPCVISLWRDDLVGRSLALDPSRPGAPTELTLAFAPAAAAIALEARDEGGQPIAGARVRVYHRRGGELEAIFSRDASSTDERGVCSLGGLPRGECLVVAEAEGFAPAADVVTIADDALAEDPLLLDLTLEHGYEVTLRPQLADGKPVTYGQYSITTEDGAPLHDRFHPRSGPDRLAGKKLRLCDGTYVVRCAAPGLADATTTFIAAPGVEVFVEMKPVD